jgi:hypothetical protein
MKRVVVLCLLCAALVGEGALAQVAAPAELTDAQVGNLITSISTLMASKLDRKLPVIPLAEWLRTEAGPGARLSWAFDSGGGIPDRVEINIALRDGRAIHLLVTVATKSSRPRVYHACVLIGREEIELQRLHDLTNTLRDTSQIIGSF